MLQRNVFLSAVRALTPFTANKDGLVSLKGNTIAASPGMSDIDLRAALYFNGLNVAPVSVQVSRLVRALNAMSGKGVEVSTDGNNIVLTNGVKMIVPGEPFDENVFGKLPPVAKDQKLKFHRLPVEVLPAMIRIAKTALAEARPAYGYIFCDLRNGRFQATDGFRIVLCKQEYTSDMESIAVDADLMQNVMKFRPHTIRIARTDGAYIMYGLTAHYVLDVSSPHAAGALMTIDSLNKQFEMIGATMVLPIKAQYIAMASKLGPTASVNISGGNIVIKATHFNHRTLEHEHMGTIVVPDRVDEGHDLTVDFDARLADQFIGDMKHCSASPKIGIAYHHVLRYVVSIKYTWGDTDVTYIQAPMITGKGKR